MLFTKMNSSQLLATLLISLCTGFLEVLSCSDQAFCKDLVASVPDCSHLKQSEREKCPLSCKLCTPTEAPATASVLSSILRLMSTADYVSVFRLFGQSDTTVEMNNLRGVQQSGVNIFYGVPYALPPVGPLRFRKPVAHPGWEGVRDATQPGFTCMQESTTSRLYPGTPNEDCLTANIFVPLNSNSTLLPVVVFIHGGSLLYGSNLVYDSRFLALSARAVVVTINYRLGLFGFLASGDQRVKGNFGLYDQKLALEWVKNNVVNFGGNPDEITIIGHSAGGRSVSAQILSPTNNATLFKRAVMLSSGLDPRPTNINNQRKTFETVIEMASCNNTVDEVECLRSKTAEEIVAITKNIRGDRIVGKIVDFNYGEEFLPGRAEDFLTWATNLNQYKVVIGLGELESSIYSGLDKTNFTMADVIARAMSQRELSQSAIERLSKLLEFNYRDYKQTDPKIARVIAQLEMLGDYNFNIPAVTFADKLRQINVTTYFFRLVHPVYQSSLLQRPDYLRGRMLHEDVVIYLFNAAILLAPQGDDANVGRNMVGALRSFIHTGIVSVPQTDVTWEVYDPARINTLKIGINYSNEEQYFARSRDLWENMVPYTISDSKCSDVASTTSSPTTPPELCADLDEYLEWKEEYLTWLEDYKTWKAKFRKYKDLADAGKACAVAG